MGKRVVETFFHDGSGRWKNRIVGGPDLPNEYLSEESAARDGRGFAEFLSCDFRVVGGADPTEVGPESETSPEATALRARAINGRIQALAARLERLESGQEDEACEGEDALRAELAAQVAGQLAEAAHEYAAVAHAHAAQIHLADAGVLDRDGETERAALHRKAAAVDEELAATWRAPSSAPPQESQAPLHPAG